MPKCKCDKKAKSKPSKKDLQLLRDLTEQLHAEAVRQDAPAVIAVELGGCEVMSSMHGYARDLAPLTCRLASQVIEGVSEKKRDRVKAAIAATIMSV